MVIRKTYNTFLNVTKINLKHPLTVVEMYNYVLLEVTFVC